MGGRTREERGAGGRFLGSAHRFVLCGAAKSSESTWSSRSVRARAPPRAARDMPRGQNVQAQETVLSVHMLGHDHDRTDQTMFSQKKTRMHDWVSHDDGAKKILLFVISSSCLVHPPSAKDETGNFALWFAHHHDENRPAERSARRVHQKTLPCKE